MDEHDLPDDDNAPARITRVDIDWRRYVLVVLYVALLLMVGGLLADNVSATAGAALVVVGLGALVLAAIRSRNRGGDAAAHAEGGEIYAAGGEWDVGAGGDGGGGGGD